MNMAKSRNGRGVLPAVDQQREAIRRTIEPSLEAGQQWFVIDARWFQRWKDYVGYDEESGVVGEDSAYPGPIDNSALLRDRNKSLLKDELSENVDYCLIHCEAWKLFMQWYHLVPGQSPILRKVIEEGMFAKRLQVEIYPMELDLQFVEQSGSESTRPTEKKFFSRSINLGEFELDVKQLFGISNDKEIRLWTQFGTSYEELKKKEDTLADVGLHTGSTILVELADEPSAITSKERISNATNTNYSSMTAVNGVTSGSSLLPGKISSSSVDGVGCSFTTQPLKTYGGTSFGSGISSSSSLGHSSTTSSYYSNGHSDGYRATYTPGLCGLNNLGNTCFMNSAIQCMSNVPSLTQYMLSDKWEDELNVDNPLGMRGEIATTYAQLIQTMWSGRFNATVPKNFKLAVGRFKPEFSGYQQQDSQELMAFLLDGLHEDLNRIKRKPYIETKEANDRPDEIVAKETWSDYVQRNDSVIVDTFHGLLKSTLVCPDCNKVSVKFDPFCYLSLPLPVKKDRQIDVIFVPADPQQRSRLYKLTLPKTGTVANICSVMQSKTGIRKDMMAVVDVYHHRFHKIFGMSESLTSILDRDDIFVYELQSSIDDEEVLHIPVYMREHSKSSQYQNSSSPQLFGQPMVITVQRAETTYDTLYNAIFDKLVKYIKVSDLTEAWWKKHETPASSCKPEGSACDGTEMRSYADGKAEDSSSTEEESSDVNERNDDDIAEEPDVKMDEKRVKTDSSVCDNNLRKSKPTKRRLFTIHNVNSAGSADVDILRDNGEPITFMNHPYLAISWNPKAKELFYYEKGDEEMDQDDSMNAKSKKEVQLTDCLDLFTNNERLGEQDLWFCPACKQHKQASKKFDLWSLPQVLVIHLKRFSYNRHSRDKLDTFVNFPLCGLDLKRWIINKKHGPAIYDLIGVSNHYGGLGGGHYTAYGLNSVNNKWYHFDDLSVRQVSSQENVVTKSGYVLVYKRQDSESSVDPAYPLSINEVGRQSTTAATATSANVVNGNSVNEDLDDNIANDNSDQDEREDDDMEVN